MAGLNVDCNFMSIRVNPRNPWLIFFLAEFVYQLYHLSGCLSYADKDRPCYYAVTYVELT
jgi:hypothetical protein